MSYINDGDKVYIEQDGARYEVPPYVVTKVEVNDNFILMLTFVTGERKSFDMKPRIHSGGIFAPLSDEAVFRKAHIEGPSVAWNDAIDIAPETLYSEGVLA